VLDPYERFLMMEQETALDMGRETPMPDEPEGAVVLGPDVVDDPGEVWRKQEFMRMFHELLSLLDRRDKLEARIYDVRTRIKDLMPDSPAGRKED
jgi:hypothetical protein